MSENRRSRERDLCMSTVIMQVSMRTWTLGVALCKLVPLAAGTNVFVSTLSITAIALDRFHLIVHPTEKDPLLVKSCVAMVKSCVYW